MADFKYSAGIDVNLNVKGMNSQLKDLQKQLQQISNMKIDLGTSNLTADIEKASEAAMKLSAHLATATNPQTGNLDFTKFYTSIQKSGASLEDYGKALQNMGPAGQKAFVSLADSISKAEIPLKRTSKLVDGMWDNLKKTVGWQLSSSMVHGFIGSFQQAMGYAKDLNKSLTDIRIVTGQSTDQMAQFAKQANQAAKNLSTTTTDYTKASLIYYQQGLSDQEVKARTETTIKMANATGTSAQKVSDQMTAIWNNFDNGTKSLTHYADVMTALGAATASSTDEIAQGLQKFAAISDTVGLSYEYAASALATITSTSRESADVVGNSLKTLFSRIQGLQLGKTLDDGTTLNKYSTALAKVGISIKDSSGELKDMDLILDEMGNKWGTLARDEKMALAQTVAGVRQYTQLMTLMENWDSFKQNLNIANTSSGTLDQQAAIYAESWEAASQRVRASWEGLWDNVINSDGFIAALDLASGFIDMIDNMITGLGGASGAFLTFGGVLSKVFNKQIASTISDVGYNISMLTGRGQKKMLAAKDDFVTKAMQSVDRDMPITLGKEYESKAVRSSMEQSLGLSMLYSQNAGRLSEQQLMAYDAKKKMLEQVQQEAIEAGSRYDQSRAKRGDLFWKLADNDMAYNTGLGAAIPEKINPEQQSKTRLAEIDAELAETQNKLNRHNRADPDGLFALSNQIKALTEEKKALLSGQQSSDFLKTEIPENIKETLESKQADIEKLTNQNKELLGDKTEQDFLSSKDEKLKEKQEQYKQNKAVIEANTASKNYIETQSGKKIQTYSDALIRQAEQTVNLQQKLNNAFSNNDENSLINGLNEFVSLSANNLEGNNFIQGLNKVLNREFVFDNDGNERSLQEQLNAAMGGDFAAALTSFQKTSMDTIGEKIWGQLSEERKTKAGFESKEDFLSALRDSYLGTEIADADRKRKAEEAGKIAAGLQDDLLKEPEKDISGTERLVLGASGIMEAVAAGEALNATINSFADGSATFSSAISGMASTVFNAASGFDSITTALNGIKGITPGIASGIGIVVTALSTLLPLILDFIDKSHVSDKEHEQNLIDSSNELATYASTTEQHLENVKTQNEQYLEGVKKIKSLDQDPATLAEDIYESNKRAFELIDEYGLAEDQYTRAGNGLIEISKDVLQTYGENTAEQSKITADYANVLGQAAIDTEQAEKAFSEAESKKADVLDYLVMPTQSYNSEYGDTLYHQKKQKYDSLTNEGREILKGIIGEEALNTGAISAERIANAINSGEWDRLMGEVTSNQSQFDAIKQIGLDYNNASSDQERANIMYDSAARMVSSKMLADTGYNVNEDGYDVKSQMLAEKVSAEMQSQMPWLDTKSTAALAGDNLETAKRLIAQNMGISVTDIKDVGVDEAGQITYKYGDDSTQGDPISRQTLNTWKATEEVLKQQGSLVNGVNTEYNNLVQQVGEAGAHIQQLGTVSGASADSVKELYEQGDKAFKDKYGEDKDAQKTATEEYDKVARIFDSKNGIGSQLSSEILANVDMGVLEALQDVMDVDEASAQGVMDLFTGIQEMTGDADPEKAAKLLTALSQMDFSGNDYLNASNLLSVLEDLGYSVNEGSLPAIYAWLCKITGLGKGENFEDTATSLSNQKKALNKIKPGEAVDKETRDASGLPRSDFVLDENDQWVYTGTQEDIDNVKLANNSAFAQSYARRASMNKYFKDNYKGSYTGFSDVDEFKRALNQKTLTEESQNALYAAGVSNRGGLYYDKDGNFLDDNALTTYLTNQRLLGSGDGYQYQTLQDFYAAVTKTTSSSAEADYFGLKQNEKGEWFETDENGNITGDAITDFTPYMNAFNEGATAIDSETVQEQMASITSAKEMMDALRNNRVQDNGFFDEQGIISDEAMARLESFPPTSERAAKAYDELVVAKRDYQAALNDDDSTNDEAAEKIYNEAMSNYDLATSIDAIAEARNLDAEAVAFYADQIQSSGLYNGLSVDEIADLAADMAEQTNALDALSNGWSKLQQRINSTTDSLDKAKAFQELGNYIDQLTSSTITAGMSAEQLAAGYQKFINAGGQMSKVIKGDREEIAKLARSMKDYRNIQVKTTEAVEEYVPSSGNVVKFNKKMTKSFGEVQDEIDGLLKDVDLGPEGGIITPEMLGGQENYDRAKQLMYDAICGIMDSGNKTWEEAAAEYEAINGETLRAANQGVMDASADVEGTAVNTNEDGDGSQPDPGTKSPPTVYNYTNWKCEETECPDGLHYTHTPEPQTHEQEGTTTYRPSLKGLEIVKASDAKKSGGGGGGGGGGGAKEPKKVPVKRKSQTVKRYKQGNFARDRALKAKKSEEQKKDYLYGERRIEQLEKINTLAQKEAHITADRIKESREYLVEDRQNLIKMLSKYGFDAEFEKDGFLASYEKVWNEIYQEIAALYEDNLLTEEESAIEEDLNIKLEELEGALEDYENSLKELDDDIEKYEESLYEMYDNKIEGLEHKIEFKIELEEDDLEYLDFWIESLGDSVYNAIEAIEALGAKANHLFDGLEVYKQSIEDIYALSDDPFQVWATGGLENVLTQDQVDLLRDNRDGLADYMQQLIDLREEIKDKVINTFDLWTERIEANISSIEHYSSVIEHFKNMVETIGADPFGLSDMFVNQLEQSAINQSLDYMEGQKAYHESLIEQQVKAQEELDAARARGDESSAEHWEEVVRTTTEAMEEAQDSLLSDLENTLTMIAEQFEAAMQRAVDVFNEAIYNYGGMEGLSSDYDAIRANADLMAADYEKIYELSKLTRDINKVLDDTNIVAGKKKMNALLKEINELQANGVELSKYDLEYMRAKYELKLAEIELENAQNSKDTVRLSKDSEGNWSYVYTQNADAVEEAEQKYEDALYEMQNLSQEYLKEMSSMMLDTSSSMMEEISALRIQDFTSYEEYQSEIKRIQDKYAQSLKHQESELNKAIQNSSDLYEQDWQAYNQATGYKISLAEKWVDSFRETTLGDMMDIDTFMSGFSETFLGLADQMGAQLTEAAMQYFTNVDTAMKTYGTSIAGFGQTATTTIDNISTKSKTAKDDLKIMASEMSDAFKEIADYVADWQEEFSGQIDEMLEEIKTLIQSINEAIRKSAELSGGASGAEGLIGSAEAIELLNKTGLFGSWSSDGSSGVRVDGKATNFVDYNAALIEEIDNAVARYANAKTGTEEREKLGEELKELFKRYWQFRDIVNRVYDPTNLTTNMDAPTFTSMDTGGYTGEWGSEGKMAMLHEKELVLNANDTSNFLDALNISKEIINSMIEMNARASSLGFGALSPSNVPEWNQTLEQTVTITAEFPDATDHNEIEEAFNNLLNTASQYANRNRD